MTLMGYVTTHASTVGLLEEWLVAFQFSLEMLQYSICQRHGVPSHEGCMCS